MLFLVPVNGVGFAPTFWFLGPPIIPRNPKAPSPNPAPRPSSSGAINAPAAPRFWNPCPILPSLKDLNAAAPAIRATLDLKSNSPTRRFLTSSSSSLISFFSLSNSSFLPLISRATLFSIASRLPLTFSISRTTLPISRTMLGDTSSVSCFFILSNFSAASDILLRRGRIARSWRSGSAIGNSLDFGTTSPVILGILCLCYF